MDLIRVRTKVAVEDSSTYVMFVLSLAAVAAIGALVHQQMWHGRPNENRLVPVEQEAPKPSNHRVLTA
ncbi:MAG: hypothetical protein V4692_00210 [Bdellovibrionota bacterium]